MSTPAPHNQTDSEHTLPRRLRALVHVSRVQLFWDRYAQAVALAALMLGLFLVGAFTGLWERIGDPWRLITLIIAVYFTIKAALVARKITAPSPSAAKRRVEHHAGIKHRPLDVLVDRPATDNPLWDAHKDAARARTKNLKLPPWPKPLAPIDPYYLRFILPLLLIGAFCIGYGENFERFKRGLTPQWQYGVAPSAISFDAWVDPPAYTGRPPIYFQDKTQIDVPAGSELVARISGAKSAPRLKVSKRFGSSYLPLTRLGPESFEARTRVNKDMTAQWRVGTRKKTWTIKALADAAPTVAFVNPPKADKRDRLAFTYALSDDYGVLSLSLHMERLTDAPQTPTDEPAVVERIVVPMSSDSVRKTEASQVALDLSRHKWAGKKVSAVLEAKDGLGQTSQSDRVYFTVPDKIFIEPLAKAVAEHRALVLMGDAPYAPYPRMTREDWENSPVFDEFEPRMRIERAPPTIKRAADLIDAVTDMPDEMFSDPVVYLGLRNVAYRLRFAENQDDLAGVHEDLWNLAIRAEYGVLGTALEEMREAEQALRDGIARRVPQREVDLLFSRYNDAVDRYMDELRREAMENGNISQAGGAGGGPAGNTDDIQALLDAIEEANRIGDTEGARRALAQLAQLLENMEIQLAQGQGGGGGEGMGGEISEEMQESLEELADTLGEQRELQDDTEQTERQDNEQSAQERAGNGQSESDQGRPEQPGAGAQTLSPQELAERQDALERSLDSLAENLSGLGASPDADGERRGAGGNQDPGDEESGGGEASNDGPRMSPQDALGAAREAMRRSADALQQGRLGESSDAQSDAIAALRDIGEGLARQVQSENARNGQEAGNNEQADPLGRENGGGPDENSEADLDQRDNATRSRELLDELRRRASEQDREKSERDYLERLLKQF